MKNPYSLFDSRELLFFISRLYLNNLTFYHACIHMRWMWISNAIFKRTFNKININTKKNRWTNKRWETQQQMVLKHFAKDVKMKLMQNNTNIYNQCLWTFDLKKNHYFLSQLSKEENLLTHTNQRANSCNNTVWTNQLIKTIKSRLKKTKWNENGSITAQILKQN